MDLNNLDDIKRQWRQTNAPLDSLTRDTVEMSRRAMLRRGSAQDALRRQYRRMSILAGVGLAMWLCITFASDMLMVHTRVWVALAATVFFSLCAGIDLYLMEAVSRIDIATWGVSRVALEGHRLLRIHKLSILLLLPLALGLAFSLVCSFDVPDDERRTLIGGVIAGGAIGIIIGIIILLRFLRLYRRLNDEL